MLLFVKHYKEEALGVGEVALPGEGGALREAAIQRTAKEAKDRSNSNLKDAGEHQEPGSGTAPAAGSTNGTDESSKTEFVRKTGLNYKNCHVIFHLVTKFGTLSVLFPLAVFWLPR